MSESESNCDEVSENEKAYAAHLCQDIEAEHAACLQLSAFAAVCAQSTQQPYILHVYSI